MFNLDIHMGRIWAVLTPASRENLELFLERGGGSRLERVQAGGNPRSLQFLQDGASGILESFYILEATAASRLMPGHPV